MAHLPTRPGRLAAAVLALVATSVLPAAQQEIQGRALVDRDYGFRLALPPAWRVLPEEDIRALVPDAVAGAMRRDGVYGTVVPEATFGADLEDYAHLLVDNMALEEKYLAYLEPEEFQGHPAIRFEVTGLASGIRFRFQNLVFVRDGFAMQLIAWGAAAIVRGDDLREFHSGVTVLEGEIRARDESVHVADAHGVGWRVENGTFVSAALGIEVTPTGRWRLAIGPELAGMNADAEIGLIHANPDLYITVIAEPAFDVDQERFREIVVARGMEGMEPSGETRVFRVGDREVEFEEWLGGGSLKMRFLRATFFQGDLCVQLVAWHWASLASQADELLPDALAGVRFLSDAEVAGVSRDLEALPDTQNRVGTGFALRGGVYREFEHGFAWSKPQGLWRVLVGQEARVQDPEATLFLEEPSLGIYGLVLVEPAYETAPEEFHDLVVGALVDPGQGREPVPIELRGATALFSEVDVSSGGLAWSYAIATVVRGDVALQMVLYSMSGNMRAASDAVRACVEGLAFPGGLVARRTVGDIHVDQRMGYRLELPSGTWHHRDPTPPAIRPLAAFDEWRSPQGVSVLVFALCAIEEGQDEDWIRGFFQDLMSDRIGGPGKASEVSESYLAGQPCRFESWQRGSRKLWVYHLFRDNTFYGLVIDAPERSKVSPGAIVRGFELLD